MAQLSTLVEVAGITPQSNVLDVGCGIGLISDYLSDATGAQSTASTTFASRGHQAGNGADYRQTRAADI